jgi:hypothetical protein
MGHYCQMKFTMSCTGNEKRAEPRRAALGEDEGN